MKAMILYWRTLMRRKTSVLLVTLFSTIAMIFLSSYPLLIRSAEQRLEEAYDSISVTGWIINCKSFTDPEIPGSTVETILETGLLGTYQIRGYLEISIPKQSTLKQVLAKLPSGYTEEAYRKAYETSVMKGIWNGDPPEYKKLCGMSSAEAEKSFLQQSHLIQWAEGYSLDYLDSDTYGCVLPESAGYALGDRIPVALRPNVPDTDSQMSAVILEVVGLYPKSVNDDIAAYCPLKTVKRLNDDLGWEYSVQSFLFEVKDNHDLPALKQALTDLGLDGSDPDGEIRAAIDDRVFLGTVTPIQSNLDLLKGLQRFFYFAVAIIGFFLCFLQAKNRKPEYAVMRMLGESTARVTFKALLEQVLLCVTGIGLGAVLLLFTGKGQIDIATCCFVLAFYVLGATLAVLLTVRVNVMEILRDKE